MNACAKVYDHIKWMQIINDQVLYYIEHPLLKTANIENKLIKSLVQTSLYALWSSEGTDYRT